MRRALFAAALVGLGLLAPAGAARQAGPGGAEREAQLRVTGELVQKMNELYAAGKYAEAAPLGERLVSLREQLLGPQHPEVAHALNKLGLVYQKMGLYERAEPLQKRALGIREAALGREHVDVADSLHNLGALYELAGAHEKAEPLLRRALAIREHVLGPDHPDVARTLHNLALVYKTQGAYDRAEPLQKRALAILEKQKGAASPDVLSIVNNLASLYYSMGDFDRAEALYQRALTTREKVLGPSHPDVATSLNNLAALYERRDDYTRAQPLLERALAIREKTLGPAHPEVAQTLTNLAGCYAWFDKYDRAEALHKRAIAIREATLGPDHPLLASPIANLATLYLQEGQYARAEPLYRRALGILERALGPEHPDLVELLGPMATLECSRGHPERATPLLRRSLFLLERTLRIVRLFSTEARLTTYLASLRTTEDLVYSLLRERPGDPAVRELALEMALLRKGRSIDEASDTSRAILASLEPADRTRFDRLRTLRSRLAGLTLGGPGRQSSESYRAALVALERESGELEEELAQRSAALRAARRLPAPDEVVGRVQKALPPDGALVEIVAYSPYQFRHKGRNVWLPMRYVALVLRPDGKSGAVDLGPAQPLDQAVAHLLTALTHPEGDARPAAQALYARTLAPLSRLVGDRARLLVSPDGQLSLVPFGALFDGHAFVDDRYAVSYLSSGRDLVRAAEPARVAKSVAILADPAFAAAGAAPLGGPGASAALASGGTSRRDRALTLGTIPPLPGTRSEAEAIARLLPGARLYLGAAATEPALLGLSAPGILHVATHGLFLDDPASPSGVRGVQLVSNAPTPENPLLRSALVLAGAQALAGRAPDPAAPDRPDGLATALEVAGMNLWGTQLVVLSACDSGRGDARPGQGVYGLRRALVIAGAETLVTSLWRIDDEVTRDLMLRYYRALLSGQGRADAMREAARATRQAHPHPYYWAPFVVIGETRPLQGFAGQSSPP